MTAQLSITDIDNTLKIRDIFPAIPEAMITEVISFINPDVAQTYTDILRLNATMPNEHRCILATACGSSDDGFVNAYKHYNPESLYIIDPTWQDLCQITALKKVIELCFVRTSNLRRPDWECYDTKHYLEILCNGVFTNDPRYGKFTTLPDEYELCTGYITRENTVLSFIVSGFDYVWQSTPILKLDSITPYFFYILANRKSPITRKRVIDYQYKHGIITDKKKPLVTDSIYGM